MKYTVEGFSQEKLVQYGLKHDDALILRWFLDFGSCGKMKRIVQENENHEKNVYYWINYQAIIEELPCLDITSTKSIQLKFKKYVELGLLDKIVVSGGSNGMQSFYAIKEKMLELEYSSVPSSAKLKASEEKIIDNYVKKTSKKENKEVCPNCGIQNPSTEDCKVCQDSKIESLSDLNINKEHDSGVEKNFHSRNDVNPEWKKISSPEAGVEKNFQSGVEKNFQSVYINSSIKNSSTTLSNPSTNDSERAEILKNAVKEFFDGSLALFSDDLIPKLITLTESLEDNMLKAYVKYTYLLVKAQQPKKPQGMFYKFVLQNNTLDAFVSSIKDKNDSTTWICPVCSTKNSYYQNCKTCDVEFEFRNDLTHIKLNKQVFELPLYKRNEFKTDLQKIRDSLSFTDIYNYQKQKLAVYEKYGIKE